MNISQIKNIYLANGLNDFKVTDHSDIYSVHGIKVSEISGYSSLAEHHKSIFDSFIINFYNAQGLESRDGFIPISINYVLDEESLGKIKESDDHYIPLGGRITAIFGNEQPKVLNNWKDRKYKHLHCIQTEKKYYLRFEYRNSRSKEWQHVISASE